MANVNPTTSISKCAWSKHPNQKSEIQKSKIQLTMYCSPETNLRFKDIHRSKVKRQKKKYHENGNHKRARVTILISDK